MGCLHVLRRAPTPSDIGIFQQDSVKCMHFSRIHCSCDSLLSLLGFRRSETEPSEVMEKHQGNIA